MFENEFFIVLIVIYGKSFGLLTLPYNQIRFENYQSSNFKRLKLMFTIGIL